MPRAKIALRLNYVWLFRINPKKLLSHRTPLKVTKLTKKKSKMRKFLRWSS